MTQKMKTLKLFNIMKNLFCTYEHSLKLKELGFKKPCVANFTNHRELIHQITRTKNGQFNYFAPIHQQAIEFLMSKLESVTEGAFVEITLCSDGSGHFSNELKHGFNEFNNLDEAIEILIENVEKL